MNTHFTDGRDRDCKTATNTIQKDLNIHLAQKKNNELGTTQKCLA